MCVSGLILDPQVPIRAIFTSFSIDNPLQPTTAAAIIRPAPTTSTRSTTHLGRKGTILHRLRDFYGNVTRPFALATHPSGYGSSPVPTTSAATSSVTLVGPAPPGRKRTDTTTTLLEKTSSSSSNAYTQPQQPQQQQQKDVLILPFQFSINLARGVTRRHLPYLRHSWTRTDALSVIAFWIAFILAQTGVERGSHHIGLFRALSVLRTARLLAITSGTTVRGTAHYSRRASKDADGTATLLRPSCTRSRRRVHCSPAWRILCCLPWHYSRTFRRLLWLAGCEPTVRMLQDNRHPVVQWLHAPVVLLGGDPRRDRNAARPFLRGIH